MIVVNLFGAPSSGKTTGATSVFSRVKMAAVNAVYLNDPREEARMASDALADDPESTLLAFAKQLRRMRLAERAGFEVVVTDAPLLAFALREPDEVLGPGFDDMVERAARSTGRQMNYLLVRNRPYDPVGRRETEDEADAIHAPLMGLLETRASHFDVVPGDDVEYEKIAHEAIAKATWAKKAGLYEF